jgi:hypothetical protein
MAGLINGRGLDPALATKHCRETMTPCRRAAPSARLLATGMIVALSFAGVSCDSVGGRTESKFRSTRLSRDCAPSVVSADSFAVKFLNVSDYRIDSVFTGLHPERTADRTLYQVFPTTRDSRSQCYTTFPKAYRGFRGEERAYRLLLVSSFRPHIGINRHDNDFFQVQEASGLYTFTIDVERFQSIHVPLFAFFRQEDSVGPKRWVRVVNLLDSDLNQVEYRLEVGVHRIPFLAARDSTSYMEIGPAYPHSGISFIVGADTVEAAPTDNIGSHLMGPGHYVSRIDTVNLNLHREVGRFRRESGSIP